MVTDPAEPPSGRGSTYRFLITPKWIAFHLLVVIVVVAMINLAFWQLRRLDERRDFNTRVSTNEMQPPASFDDLRADLVNPSAIEWRPVEVTGTFVPDHEFLVVNRSQNGDVGRNVVDALQLDDGSLVLVNRGFVPDQDAVPSVPEGATEVKGHLRVSERRAAGQAADESTGVLTEIRRIDIDVLSKQFDATVLPVYIEQVNTVPPLQPIVRPILDEGPHLSYTIQWFVFSACVIVGWVLAIRRSIGARPGKVANKRRNAYIPIADEDPRPNQ